MAIAIENASIGTPLNSASGSTTATLTTNVTIASGSTVALVINQTDNPVSTITDNSGNGYTWSYDQNAINSTQLGIASLYATSGLASGTVITVTFTGSSGRRQLAGISWTGGASSSRLDQSNSRTAFGGSTAWNSSSITPSQANTIVIGAFSDFGTTGPLTSTPDSGWTEWVDLADSDKAVTAVYQIVSDTSARNPSGVHSTSTIGDQVGVTVNYKAAGGGTNITLQPAASIITASIVAPPLPRPVNPFSEVNLRM